MRRCRPADSSNVARLAATTVAPVVADATSPAFRADAFDHVLIDAPCSGLGSLRRRADARWRIQPNDITELAALQQRMINECAPLAKVGGSLVYSVCTLLAAESIDHKIPAGFESITAAPDGQWRPFGEGWRLLPHDAGTDGMIVLRYRRTR